MSGPRLGALSNNRWSGGNIWLCVQVQDVVLSTSWSFFLRTARAVTRRRVECSRCVRTWSDSTEMAVAACVLEDCKHSIFRDDHPLLKSGWRGKVCHGHRFPADPVIARQWVINCRYSAEVLWSKTTSFPHESFKNKRLQCSRLTEGKFLARKWLCSCHFTCCARSTSKHEAVLPTKNIPGLFPVVPCIPLESQPQLVKPKVAYTRRLLPPKEYVFFALFLKNRMKVVYTGVSTVHGALCDPGLTCQIGASLGGRQQSDRKFSSPYLAPLFSVGAGRAGI